MLSDRADQPWIISLRMRLMLWNAIAVVATAMATLLGLREGVRIALVRELDQVIQEDVREVELGLDGQGERKLARTYDQLRRGMRNIAGLRRCSARTANC